MSLKYMDRRWFRAWFVLVVAGCLVAALGLATPQRAAAHAELVRASPPPDGLLAAPPRQIEIWTSEGVATGGGSPGIQVVDQSGQAQAVANVHIDPADPRHILADVSGLGSGTYTVNWTTR